MNINYTLNRAHKIKRIEIKAILITSHDYENESNNIKFINTHNNNNVTVIIIYSTSWLFIFMRKSSPSLSKNKDRNLPSHFIHHYT